MVTNEYFESKALEYGFDAAGFAPVAELTGEGERLKEWLSCGYNGGMAYMERNIEKRIDVRQLFPEAKSVISLVKNYYPGDYQADSSGKVSRYAWGKDYHTVLTEKIAILTEEIKKCEPGFEFFLNVDAGPVMDKAWAVRAGIGWLGKHTNVIMPKRGSYFFLATLLVNIPFAPSGTEPDRCGTCTACIDACPTNAIVSPYVLDSRRCISYLTIENKNEIPEEHKGKLNGWIFGCDICQEVCPWNKRFARIEESGIFEPYTNKTIPLDSFDTMEPAEFKERFRESPIVRAKLKGMQRNTAMSSEQ